ncbi:hypothetical protein [Neisseria animalis]|uniref:LPD3 domain-containing protein n=1 Tax=Neisseria animalis TaxID=492 RepID=UPI000F4E0056|nr:hypothetical protein [Neisseria animalis]ROW32925.1 hypothetical protein CGZ60_01280 [Neisseria animalis]
MEQEYTARRRGETREDYDKRVAETADKFGQAVAKTNRKYDDFTGRLMADVRSGKGVWSCDSEYEQFARMVTAGQFMPSDTAAQGVPQRNRDASAVAPVETQAAILQGAPVSVLSDTDLAVPVPKSGGIKAVVDWAADLFRQWGNAAVNPIIGRVELKRRSAKDSLAHGKFNPAKNLAFAGVKDVLEKGVVVAEDSNEQGEKSFYISAPVMMNDKQNVVTALVHRDPNTQRLYLHSVSLKENLLKPEYPAPLGNLPARTPAH